MEEAERVKRDKAQIRAEVEAKAKELAKEDAENELKRMRESHNKESEALQVRGYVARYTVGRYRLRGSYLRLLPSSFSS